MKCAHCHTHKYDPLPQRDYYRLAAVFKGAYDEHDWLHPLYIKETTVIRTKTLGRLLPYVTPGKTPYELAEEERSREDFNGEIDRQLSIDLGSGGSLVRAVTTNGGVSIKRKST